MRLRCARVGSIRLCMKVVTCLVFGSGCSYDLRMRGYADDSPAAPSATGGGYRGRTSSPRRCWDLRGIRKPMTLREIDGVPGAARVDASAAQARDLQQPWQQRISTYGLLLDSKGALYLATVPGGVPRQLASGPWSGLAISASGDYAVAYSRGSSARDYRWPSAATSTSVARMFREIGFTAAAVSDTGVVLLATKPSGRVPRFWQSLREQQRQPCHVRLERREDWPLCQVATAHWLRTRPREP